MKRLSVVIPAFNEEKDIEKTILDIVQKLPEAEVIVVNDASTDRTLMILEAIKERLGGSLKILTNEKNMGHGYSVVRGLWEAEGDWVLYIDADRQIDISNLSKLEAGDFDLASGWRYNRHDKLFRKAVSFCLKMTILFRFGIYIKDANCPFKLYRRDSLIPLLTLLPESKVIPIACLDVIARQAHLKTVTIKTYHKPYEGVRNGFLQLPDHKFFEFCSRAFFEIIRI